MGKLLKILKENNPQSGELEYSQGRIYLAISVISYYLTLGILITAGIYKSNIDLTNFTIVVDALEFAMVLFAGYVFGGKVVDIFKGIKSTLKDKQIING
jgi:hypothetical protein